MPDRTDPEAEYVARIEREQNAVNAEHIAAENAVAALAARKALHAGCCGRCGGRLLPRPFRGVEIDVCEDCGVVLLDPGELEQLAGQDSTGLVSELAKFFSFGR